MTLLTRLIAPLAGEAKLPAHQFMAALAELKRGAPGVTQAAIATAFNLSAAEQTSLATFVSNMQSGVPPFPLSREQIHDVLMLGEMGIYTVAQAKSRLGV